MMSTIDIWAVLMLVAGGMFAGATASFTWYRLPLWRRMSASDFVSDFSATIALADKVQPALLLVTIVSALRYGGTKGGDATFLAAAAAVGFAVVLVGSVAGLVPLQRKIIALASEQPAVVDRLRPRWFSGHVARTVVSTLSLVGLAAAAAV